MTELHMCFFGQDFREVNIVQKFTGKRDSASGQDLSVKRVTALVAAISRRNSSNM